MAPYVPLTLLLVWCVVCFLVSVWCTTKIGLTVYQVLNESNEYARGSQSSRKSTKNTLRWIMICTFISSLCFTLVLCIWLPTRITYMLCLGWPNQTSISHCSNQQMHRIDDANYSGLFWLFLGYLSLLSLSCERHRMVFGTDTRFGWSRKTIWIVRILTGVCVCLTIIQFPIYIIFGNAAGLSVMLFVLVIYPFLSGYCAYHYLKSTRELAESIDSSDLSRDLLNVAVRLTIVASTALLTTIFAMLFSFLSTAFPFLTMVRQTLWISDMLINNWALLCFFKTMEGYYQIIFGKIHQYWLNKFL